MRSGQSRIKLLEARLKNKLVGPSLASLCKKYPLEQVLRKIYHCTCTFLGKIS